MPAGLCQYSRCSPQSNLWPSVFCLWFPSGSNLNMGYSVHWSGKALDQGQQLDGEQNRSYEVAAIPWVRATLPMVPLSLLQQFCWVCGCSTHAVSCSNLFCWGGASLCVLLVGQGEPNLACHLLLPVSGPASCLWKVIQSASQLLLDCNGISNLPPAPWVLCLQLGDTLFTTWFSPHPHRVTGLGMKLVRSHFTEFGLL